MERRQPQSLQAWKEAGQVCLQLQVPAPDHCPVSLSILECQGLPIVNGQCDPYATVTLAGPFRQVVFLSCPSFLLVLGAAEWLQVQLWNQEAIASFRE